MKLWQIILGVSLFLASSMIADLVTSYGFGVVLMGQDYAGAMISKVLDVLAGSFIVWGVFDFKRKR